jgi:hypothetical protein
VNPGTSDAELGDTHKPSVAVANVFFHDLRPAVARLPGLRAGPRPCTRCSDWARSLAIDLADIAASDSDEPRDDFQAALISARGSIG